MRRHRCVCAHAARCLLPSELNLIGKDLDAIALNTHSWDVTKTVHRDEEGRHVGVAAAIHAAELPTEDFAVNAAILSIPIQVQRIITNPANRSNSFFKHPKPRLPKILHHPNQT